MYNVGEFTIDGIFESKYTASALSLFDADKILGSGELRVASGLYLAPTADMSDFSGKISIFKAHDAQNPAIIFVSQTNNPAKASFELAEGARALFTNGDYVLNGKISGVGTLSADKSVDITLADGTEILKGAAPANVVVRGDISEFTGAYSASEGSSIRIESQLADSVNFSGSTGGILELAGGIDGAQKKSITVYSTSNTTTSGSVFMYGNTPIIGQNSNDGGTLGANGGYIYFGGNNEYSATEKISHTFDSTTVLGNTAGNVAIGGSGEGSSMEDGADIVVDGVKMYSLTGGGADGASVKGDISLTVKSGEVENLVGGGRGGVHVGNTSITVENGSVSNIYGGDPNPIIFIRYLDMIPLVCLQQMVGICIFFQDCGTGFSVYPCRLIAVITAKTCSRIMIPTVSHIVKLQGITVQKDAITPFLTFPYIIGILRIRSHPKTIQVTQAIAFCLNNDARIVLNGYLATHLFFSPKS